MIITLFFAGIIAGLIQYFVDFKGLKLYEPTATRADGLMPEPEPGFWKKLYTFVKNHWQFFGYLTVGVAGALLTPLIDEWTGQKLAGLGRIRTYVTCIPTPTAPCKDLFTWDYLVLLGYGIILGYSGVRIIRTLGSFVMEKMSAKQLEQQKELEEAKKKIKELEDKIKDLPKPPAKPESFVSFASFDQGNVRVTANYFDETQNEIDKKVYYAGIDLENPAQLFTNLNKLLSVSHKTRLSYKPALHLYPLVDRYEDRQLRSIYSGKPFDLETILALDAEVDKARAELMAGFTTAGFTDDEMSSEIAAVEAKLPYNCEHVVPQSWFGEKEPMRGDLHHLFTCETHCNSYRSNHPYFDFPDYPAGYADLIRDECGKLEKNELDPKVNRFEPEVNQGVVARATLYFLTRYPHTMISGKGYTAKDIPMLIKWHKENKVTLYELHRNQQIYKAQGNRNPLIDFPELADKIDFAAAMSFNAFTPNLLDDADASKEFSAAAGFAACTENATAKPWKIDNSRLADSLVQFRGQVNLAAPGRKKDSDGWFGDPAHQATNSDHNPWVWDDTTKKGIVTALDITHDPAGKCDCSVLAASLQKNKDTRVKYVIWNKQIMESQGASPWTWKAYTGTNPHDKHIHISVLCDKTTYDSKGNWTIKIS